MESETIGVLPSTAHWSSDRLLISQVARKLANETAIISAMIDSGRYYGSAESRLREAESAMREAMRHLHMAKCEML